METGLSYSLLESWKQVKVTAFEIMETCQSYSLLESWKQVKVTAFWNHANNVVSP